MSLDNKSWDVDPGYDEDELSAIRYEQRCENLVEDYIVQRRRVIARLDDKNSWDLVAKFIAMRDQEDNRTLWESDELDQEWKEYLDHKLRLPGNLKEYLLYELLLARDVGVCVFIMACMFLLAVYSVKFVMYLTHS